MIQNTTESVIAGDYIRFTQDGIWAFDSADLIRRLKTDKWYEVTKPTGYNPKDPDDFAFKLHGRTISAHYGYIKMNRDTLKTNIENLKDVL